MPVAPAGVSAGTAKSLDALAGVTFGRQAPRGVAQTDDQALRRVAQEFEAIFIQELLSAMRSTQMESGLFGKERSTQMYRDMHDQAMAGELAASGATATNPGGLGIGKMLYDQLRAATPRK